jgi:predicted GNAT family N-acyltransferase
MLPEIKRITTTDPEYPQILRQPLGQSVYEDDLSHEHEELLIVALLDNEVVGCTIIKEKDTHTGKLRQMAVASALQGKGLGAQLVVAAEAMSRQKGYTNIELNARDTAVPFYERLGYTIHGPAFMEVGIPHRLMKKEWA